MGVLEFLAVLVTILIIILLRWRAELDNIARFSIHGVSRSARELQPDIKVTLCYLQSERLRADVGGQDDLIDAVTFAADRASYVIVPIA